MRINLLCSIIFFLFCTSQIRAQAPSWQWAKEANSSAAEQAWDIANDRVSSNLYICGTFNGGLSAVYGTSMSTTNGQSDGFLAKYDDLGNVIWAIKIGGTDDEEARSVATDDLGNVYVSGNFRSSCDFDPSLASFILTPAGGTGNQDGFLAKYDSQGNFIWATKFGNSTPENVWRMSVDANGVYLTGNYTGSATFNSASPSVITKTTTASQGQIEFFGVKYSLNGIAQWVVSGASSRDDVGYDVVADNNNVYFIGDFERDINLYNASGTFTQQLNVATSNNTAIFIIAYYQSNGALNWATNVGSNGKDNHGGGITQDNLNLYITGSVAGTAKFPVSSTLFTKASGNNDDMFLAKLSKSTGVFQWVSTQTASGTGDEAGFEVDADAFGNIIVAGYFSASVSFTGGTSFSTLGNEDLLLSSYNTSGNFLWATRAGANGSDIPFGLSTNTTGAVYVAGSHNNATIFGPYVLTSAGSTNIFLAKTGCETAGNNTVTASQTICTSSAPSSLSGSLPTGGNFFYQWEQSLNSNTWTPAVGTSTNQNYSPTSLLTTTYYRRNVFAGSSCSNISNSNTVTILVLQNPDLSVAGSSINVCINTSTIFLNGNIPVIGTGTWSVISGTASIASTTLGNTGLTNFVAGNIILKWSIGNGNCAVNNSTVLIKVDAIPGPVFAGNNQVICSSATVLAATTLTTGQGLWSLTSGSASILGPGTISPPITALAGGLNVFLWTVTNGACASATSAVSVSRDLPPSVANAGFNQLLCSTSATLTAVAPINGTGAWSNSGPAVVSSPNTSVTAVSAMTVGANVFLWTVQNGVCPSSTANVTVFRDAMPTSANAGTNQTICSSTAVLSASPIVVGFGSWTIITGTAVVTSPSVITTNVSGLGTGTNSFLWSVKNGVCPTSTSAVSIIRDIQPIANAGINQTVCALSTTIAALAQTPGIGTWSVLTTGPGVVSATSATTTLSSLITGTNAVMWTFANGVCPNATDTVFIYRDAFPISNAGTLQTICSTTAQLSAAPLAFGNGTWTSMGSAIVISPNTAITTVSAIAAGTNLFVWRVSNGVCLDAISSVSVDRDIQPIANAGLNQTVCALSTTIAALAQTPGIGTWSVLTTGPGVVSATSATTTLSSLITGTNAVMWTFANGVCPNARDTVFIYRDAFPISNAGTLQTMCSTTAQLSAAPLAFGNGTWTSMGSAIVISPNTAITTVSAIAAGTNLFVWRVSNGVCLDAISSVSVDRDIQPIANAGTNQTVCTLSTIIAALAQTPGTGTWSVLTTGPGVASATSATTTLSSLMTGTNAVMWTFANGVCPNARDTVFIYRDGFPVSNAGNLQTICSATAQLIAAPLAFGNGTWTTSSSALITNSNTATTNVASITTGTNVFVWTVSNGVCPTATSVVSIVRDIQPIANAGTNQTVCALSTTIAALAQTPGTGTWSVLTTGPGVVIATSATTTLLSLITGTNAVMWTFANGVCPNATDTVFIYRDGFPVSNAGNLQTICSATAQLVATPLTYGNGIWTTPSSALIANSNTATTNVTAISTGTNVFVWTVSNGVCPTATSAVSIVRDIQPIANAGTNQTVCALSTTIAALAQTPGTGTWSVLTTGPGVVSATSATTTLLSLITGTNTVMWTFANGVCPNATDTVFIYRDGFPVSNAGNLQTICSATAQLIATPLAFGNGTWTTSGSALITNSNTATTNVSSITTGTNVFVWTVSNGVCPTATSAVAIVRDIQPIANAGSNQTVCALSASLAAIVQTPGTGTWLSLNTGPIFSSNTSPTPAVSSLNTGTNTFIWVLANGVCPNSTDTVIIYRDAFQTAHAGSTQTVCSNNATLTALQPAVGTGSWTSIVGTVLSPTLYTSPVTGILTGTNTFVWTVANGVCPNVADTTYIIRDFFPIAIAAADQTVCLSTASLAALNPPHGTGTWSVLSGASTVQAVGSATTNVVSLVPGNNIFLWIAANGVCPNAVDTVIIIRDLLPLPDAGVSQTICSASAALNAIPQAYGTGSWSSLTAGNAISNTNLANTIVNGIITGTNVFVWHVLNGVCPPVNDTLIVIRDAMPVNVIAGSSQVICSATAALTALSPAIGLGTWSDKASKTIFLNPSASITNVSGLSTGQNVLLWTVVNGVCPPIHDSVIITVDALPTPAFANKDQNLCSANATMDANEPIVGRAFWQLVSGSVAFSDSTSRNTSVASLSVGVNVFRWNIINGVCPVSYDEMIIRQDALPATAIAGINQQVNKPLAQLSAVSPSVGTGYWSIVSGGGVLEDSFNSNTSIQGLFVGNNTLRWTVENGVCPANISDLIVYLDPLQIPNGFSPNGDEINDAFVVPGLDYYENVNLSVFNRWGGLVYRNDNYKNEWNGKGQDNARLADDTYYYTLQVNPEMKYSGYVIIKAEK